MEFNIYNHYIGYAYMKRKMRPDVQTPCK